MENLNTDIKIFQILPSIAFCLGEIGKSDFKSFLELIPLINLVYAALPKPENFDEFLCFFLTVFW